LFGFGEEIGIGIGDHFFLSILLDKLEKWKGLLSNIQHNLAKIYIIV